MRHKMHPLLISLFFLLRTIGLQACFEEHAGPATDTAVTRLPQRMVMLRRMVTLPPSLATMIMRQANGYRNGERHEEHEEHAEHTQHEEKHAERQGQEHPHEGHDHD
jgi:hypothetical protein